MKIICIGRNYVMHAKELGNAVPTEPVFFLKPDSAILRPGRPFFMPDFSKDIHYELELVVKINKVGKHISERFAHTYYQEIGLGLDLTARDVQKACKEKGLPWEKAKAFDGSAPIGEFLDKTEFEGKNINFKLLKNGELVQDGNTEDMLFSVDNIIAHISQFVTLKKGDLIFTGTPAGVGPVEIGDRLEGYFFDKKLIDLHIR